MKKYILSILMMIALMSRLMAQDTIPNLGFEDLRIYQNDTMPKYWTGFQGSIWADLQNGDKFGQSTDESHTGKYALKMKRDEMHSYGGIFPGGAHIESDWDAPSWMMKKFTGRPKYFSFFYKYTTTGTDTGLVKVILFNVIDKILWDTIAYTTQKLIPVNEYTEFKFPLDYVSNDTPTHLRILFSTNQVYDDVVKNDGVAILWVDDISFDGIVKTDDIKKTANNYEVIPNPVSHDFIIQNGKNERYASVKIYDRLGELVLIYDEMKSSYDVSTLMSGIYFVEITDESGLTYTQKIIKE